MAIRADQRRVQARIRRVTRQATRARRRRSPLGLRLRLSLLLVCRFRRLEHLRRTSALRQPRLEVVFEPPRRVAHYRRALGAGVKTFFDRQFLCRHADGARIPRRAFEVYRAAEAARRAAILRLGAIG